MDIVTVCVNGCAQFRSSALLLDQFKRRDTTQTGSAAFQYDDVSYNATMSYFLVYCILCNSYFLQFIQVAMRI